MDDGIAARHTGRHSSPSLLDWGGILVAVVGTYASFVGFVAIGALVIVSGFGSDLSRSDLALMVCVYGVLSVIVSAAVGAFLGARMMPPGATMLVAPVITSILVLATVVMLAPIVERVADFRSVGIALGIIDAPNVGTHASEALHRLVTSQTENRAEVNEAYLTTAWSHIRMTAWYSCALLIGLFLATGLGIGLGRRRTWTARFHRSGRTWNASGVALVAGGIGLLTILLWGSIWPVGVALFDIDQSAGPDIGIGLSEVANHPEAMWGERVTISARVDQQLGQHAIILGNDVPVIGDKVLVAAGQELRDLVLLAPEGETQINEGDVVQVTGTVRPYDSAALEVTLGIKVEAGALAGYSGKAVLLAQSIDADVPIASEAGDKEFGAGSAGYDRGVTIDDILAAPWEYVGLTVTVSDEVEEHLLTPHLFLLGDEAFLAISSAPHPELFVESTAYVTGEIRLFDLAEVERITGLDLDDDSLRAFSGQPVILVDSLLMVT